MSTKMKWRTFEESRKFAQAQNIGSWREWQEFSKSGKRPSDVPSNPNVYYSAQWLGWEDFLGTPKRRMRGSYRSFAEARSYARSLKLSGYYYWKKLAKEGALPNDIPTNADKMYSHAWKGWPDFLGNNNQPPRLTRIRTVEDNEYAKDLLDRINGEPIKDFGYSG